MKLTFAFSLLSTAVAFVPSATTNNAFGIRSSTIAKLPLFGILDEINDDDLYDLTSTKEETDVNMNDAYEMFLADLVFSTNNPKMDIINNIDRASSEEFVTWLENKIDNSKDPEERMALRDLFEMIEDVKRQLEVNELAEKRAAEDADSAEQERLANAEQNAEEGRALSNTEVLKKAQNIDTAASGDVEAVREEKKKDSFYDQEITPEIRLSYEGLLKKVLPPYKAGDSAESIAFTYYDQFDAQFVKVLDERAQNGDSDSQVLMEAIAIQQQKRLSGATNALKEVLALGEPMRMEGAIIKMTREGRVDEAFLLLLEANATQARDAGALGASQLMEKLRNRALEEKDKQASSKEISLIRKLLRTDDSAEREAILEDAFTPREGLLVRSIHNETTLSHLAICVLIL